MTTIAAVAEQSNLKDYDEKVASLSGEDAERAFSWYETGKVNMAYEAIDRHAESWICRPILNGR